MIKEKLTIKNKTGLHARPAAIFVETAKKFRSNIIIEKAGKSANAKNILQILALGVDYGDEITLIIEGEDEKEAEKELVNLLMERLPSMDE